MSKNVPKHVTITLDGPRNCLLAASPISVDISDKLKNIPFCGPVAIELQATKVGGTSLDVDIQGAADETNYTDIVSMTQLTATGREHKLLPYMTKKMKILYTIVGASGEFNATVKVSGPVMYSGGSYSV